ncbi:Transcriptional regulator RPN4 [Penicillium rolfsii]|nr:Transcriptional regulator RPN4 [Penicillium rolfsii]
MLMYPRKGLITDPFYTEDCIIQDDSYPDSFDHTFQYQQQQDYLQPSCLQPPFHYQPNQQLNHLGQLNQFASPPSSTPSSPTFSSPTFSVQFPPTTTAADSQSFGAPSMTPASSYNPSFDIQGSASPSSQYLQQYSPYYNPMLAQQQPIASNQGWDSNLQLLSPARIPFPQKASPSSATSRSPNGHRRSDSSSKPLPTPVQTPVQNSFLAAPFQNYEPSSWDGSNVDAESAMRKAIMDQQQKHQTSPQQQQQQQQGDYSLAPSVSTMSHNSPVTPQTSLDELDDSKAMTNGEIQSFDVDFWTNEYSSFDPVSDYAGNNGGLIGIPKLNRTISDIYQDELFNPTIMAAPQQTMKPMNSNLLNPRNVMADRLQAANQGHLSARSGSPAMGIKRDRSPFRQTSPFAGDLQMATSVPMPQNLMSMAHSTGNQTDLKTMSPKDAVLDLDEGADAAMPPLFPSQQGDFNVGDAIGLRRESSGSMRPAMSTMEAFPSQYASVQQPQFYQQGRPQSNLLQQTPDFPASLPRLESTGSDLHSGTITPQAKLPVNDNIVRPNATSADGGTYTCTYHGCTLRFETPAKLQRHKREAHRQTTPGGHLISRDTSLRNSQAGPHKCERINPSTGKPCNSIFSRPYDLTRHEDTIHNARKQKVRCHLCTEEKTFSRNDALTRHMRVVHPEVDWPGKQRRRGRD